MNAFCERPRMGSQRFFENHAANGLDSKDTCSNQNRTPRSSARSYVNSAQLAKRPTNKFPIY